jgi:hypothetical protein
MKKNCINLAILTLFIATVLLNTNILRANTTQNDKAEESNFTYNTRTVVNLNGDVSSDENENRICWNPHIVGLTNASLYDITFNNETAIILKTKADEAGHVATGTWWTTSFKQKTKLPLLTDTKPISLVTSFNVYVETVKCETGSEWLRIALACAIQRRDNSVVYTEMDFWDSPGTLNHPSGNTKNGGNIVYQGADVIEYKIDQISIGKWTNYTMDLTRYINSAWKLQPGDALESVYIVIETIGAIETKVKIDNLWITQIE